MFSIFTQIKCIFLNPQNTLKWMVFVWKIRLSMVLYKLNIIEKCNAFVKLYKWLDGVYSLKQKSYINDNDVRNWNHSCIVVQIAP